MKNKKVKFDLNDILIEPEITEIDSRSQITTFYKQDGFLPIFAAPMDTVVDNNNMQKYLYLKINVCLPRGERKTPSINPNVFTSYSLDEFEKEFLKQDEIGVSIISALKRYVLIDIANGHMKRLINAIKKAKKMYGEHLIIMAGNVANSEGYVELSEAGASFVRCGVGNGAGCLTTENTAIGYPMGSLIQECYKASLKLDNPAKIVADGGMKNYSDVIKSLALGADYVMLGSLLNKSLESCGDTYLFNKIKINPNSNFAKFLFKKGFTLTKKFRGMSTKEVQKKWGKTKLTTSEGVVRIRKVEYLLHKWVENLVDYLKSNMSYCDKLTIEEYVGKVKYNLISENSFKRFNK